MADIIIIVIVGAALAGVVWKKVKDQKEGKGGCGCGCSGCTAKKKCRG